MPTHTGATAEVGIKGWLFSAHPTFTHDGTDYPTGPATALGLKILMVAPFLSVIITPPSALTGLAMGVGVALNRLVLGTL